MSVEQIKQSLQNLGNALSRLREALAENSKNSLIIDGTIQRFEFVIEIYWKTLKRLLSYEGIETNSPKDTLKHAYRIGWLQDETTWLQMLQDRNATSHVYDEKKALEIYQHIKNNYPELEKVYKFLKEKYQNLSEP